MPVLSLRSAPSGVMYSMTPGPCVLPGSDPARPTDRCSAARHDNAYTAPPPCVCRALLLLCPADTTRVNCAASERRAFYVSRTLPPARHVAAARTRAWKWSTLDEVQAAVHRPLTVMGPNVTIVVAMLCMLAPVAFASFAGRHRRALGAQDAVEDQALGQVCETGVAGPQERGAGDLERVVLGARLLRLQAVEELRAGRLRGKAPLSKRGWLPCSQGSLAGS